MEKIMAYPKITLSDLKKKILEIVNDHSGGIKFTDIVCEVTEWFCSQGYSTKGTDCGTFDRSSLKLFLKFSESSDYLESVVRKMKTLKTLTYTYRQLNREKMFVYTP